MRLLLVNSAWPESWGGGEKWTVEAAGWLCEQRHTVAIAARSNSLLAQAAARREIEIHELPFGGDFDPFAVLRAKRLLMRYRPDCVAVNFNKEAWQFGFAARMRKIPVLARHGFPLLRNSAHHRFLLNKLITKLVVNAESIRDHYRELELSVEGVDVILNGVQVCEQQRGNLRKRYDIAPHQPLILAAGRLESQKRFDRVIEIAARVIPTHPDARFLILGSGPLRDELQEQIDARSLTEQVHLGRFNRDLASTIGDADLFLLTSDKEGSPNVLLEAMAAGVCCVSASVGSVPDIFGEELSENIMEPGNIDGFTARVECLLNDQRERVSFGERMQIRIAEKFSFEDSMRKFENVFAQLVLERT